MKHLPKIYYLIVALLLTLYSCKKNADEQLIVDIAAHPLVTEADLDTLIGKIGDSRIVLLGEASHGTEEYYQWRSAISKRLISEKGFNMIAVEGEWADSYRVNQFIKGEPRDSTQAAALLHQYDRWPTWICGNTQIASLVGWLNGYNQSRPVAEKVGFFGLDVYCLWESAEEMMPYIQGNDSLAQIIQSVQDCFRPFSADPIQYAYAVANAASNCRVQTENLNSSVFRATGNSTSGNERDFVLQQNALVVLNGERYYRAAARSNAESWNIRDRHMMQTVDRLLEFHGPESKLIIWAHNTHVGDARHTDMASGGMVNLGQLVRETYGQDNVFIVGFGSYEGSVIAAQEWGGAIETMRVPPARKNSFEEILHRDSAINRILFSDQLRQNGLFTKSIGHRAIGVQYDPVREAGNYVPSNIPERYDAFIFIDRTTALKPLPISTRNEPPDTYPSGY